MISSASAPGKVLVVGGYLVLEEGCPGLVVSASARMRARLLRVGESAAPRARASPALPLAVVSPQFSARWEHAVCERDGCLWLDDAAAALPASSAPPAARNALVECAVSVALAAATAAVGAAAALAALAGGAGALELRVEAGNDFYSQKAQLQARGLAVCRASLAALPRALPCPLGADGRASVAKTGLGSSAALAVAVVAAVLRAAAGARAATRALVHVCAQVAHCLAQGKVGSGFDVCAAAYGSVRYARVRPAALAAAMAAAERALRPPHAPGEERAAAAAAAAAAGYAELGALLAALASAEEVAVAAALLPAGGAALPPPPPPPPATALAADWCAALRVAPFALPRGLRLMLADVAGGSETPGMVRQVLAWREAAAAAGGSAAAAASPASAPAPGLVARLVALPPRCDAAAIAACFDLGARVGATPRQAAAMLSAARASAGPALWRAAAAANARAACVVDELGDLAAAAPPDYDAALARAARAVWLVDAAADDGSDAAAGAVSDASPPSPAWLALAHLAQALRHCRLIIRAVGDAAGVPVEPAPQTALADATARVPGVLAAGVPGAGGNDALFAIVAEPGGAGGDGASAAAVEAAWLAWPGGGLTPLLLTNGAAVGQLGAGVRFDGEGGDSDEGGAGGE
jgi:phosphomevalonate kinase